MEPSDTTIAVQRYLDELAGVGGDAPAEPLVRALLARSVDRLQILCGSLLHRSYPRLTRGPTNLCTEELLGGVVERLIKAMREVRPGNVRQFFALANRHIRWELNDFARRLDDGVHAVPLPDSVAAASPPSSDAGAGNNAQRILSAIDKLPEDEREVFSLVRLQGMTKGEAASILGVSEKTVQRRIARSVMLLAELVGDVIPAASMPMLDNDGESAGTVNL